MENDLQALVDTRHHDPHRVLGVHAVDDENVRLRTYQPQAEAVETVDRDGEWLALSRHEDCPGLFEATLPRSWMPKHPRYTITLTGGHRYEIVDPYSFLPTVGELDLHLFAEGRHLQLWQMLGAQVLSVDEVVGTRFSVWAPNAERVSLVGTFNDWDGRRHPMRVLGDSGVWELFVPGMTVGDLYKFEITSRITGETRLRTDPVGRAFELRPDTAAIVPEFQPYEWQDEDWITRREQWQWDQAAITIYEVHLGSWRLPDGRFPTYDELADQLIPYVQERGFTHIELLPVTEHPFDGSWGYQTTGYFAPTSRFGNPTAFRRFVDRAHAAGIGVILDWVPAHFPRDEFALARFDGSALYEHDDPRRGEHRDWGTLIFNYGRREVQNFLIASAQYWIEQLHLDGLRVDAVASMLYLDYSRQADDWLPNRHGGRENLEAIEFLQRLNHTILSRNPGTLMMAEESTAWPMVSRPPEHGGLGFSMKWNMGWMNDSLAYFAEDPLHRQHHHNLLTFGLLYAFSENFILPLSHDEVVHGKRALPNKMPGDEWQRFANLRLLLAWQYTFPGKKLLFMGTEFGQGNEWSHARELDWWMLDYPLHQGIQTLVDQLNFRYRNEPALHERDFDPGGFAWIDCNDRNQSVISFRRNGHFETVVAVFNFTPVPRPGYRIGVPEPGRYQVLLNTDSEGFGGSGHNPSPSTGEATPWHDQPASLTLDLPGLSAVVLKGTRA
ncbi:MAG: 1,4-alpha-glucan branching protein GlgB [Guyparkeria sp.]|uniref:1,4-alpha-glucan branching protein GlgB n=1 Tax=Guyparkeria sp. TaxID=2035736 RepID=UPI00397C2D9D